MKFRKKDGTTNPFEKGCKVLYVPKDKLMGPRSKMVSNKNLGIVSGKNNNYVFVNYDGNSQAQATNPKDLFFLDNRPDLMEMVKPIN